jgi:hypothetical protein
MAKRLRHSIVGLVLFAPMLASSSWAQDLPPGQSVSSWPKDMTPYSRPAIPADVAPAARRGAGEGVPGSSINVIRVIDAVVNNTDATLQNTDTFNDGETSIAVNPQNPDEIVMSAFSGFWGTTAPIWRSTDGGQTWTKHFSIPVPPGGSGVSGCPCDQAFDSGRGDVLFGTFLATPLYTGSTTNPASSPSWSWWTSGGVAQKSNLASTNSDQPWLLTNRDTGFGSTDNVFVGYDDFVPNPVGIRVVTSFNLAPPQFLAGSDKFVGASGGSINPGHRLAKDPRNGWMYSLWQVCPSAVATCNTIAGNPKTINYMLNRTTDGSTWTLNSSATGIVVATADSTQPNPKFGTVNALLGGVNHAAVDPATGDLYYVYGNRDASGNNRLAIRRVFDNGSGGVTIGSESFVVAGTVQAALPSVAVTDDGVVGVFYYTFNGIVSGFPQFSTFLAVSTDQGATFNTQLLATFLSPATDDGITTNGVQRQRVFGDYVQMKAVNNCFYGSFTGNGAAFGRSTSNNDPIFFKACVPLSNANRNFDGDATADILWRKQDTGDLALWFFTGGSVSGTAGLGSVSTAWRIAGGGDFNGDGRADILWRHSSGAVAIWFMNGGSVIGTAGLGTVATVWKIVAVNDFNGDGRADILWRNTTTGDVAIWLMNGSAVTSSVVLGAVSFDWTPEKAADINGDGRADIQWRHNSGAVAIWFMNGGSVIGSAGLGTVPLAWQIVRLADVNGDGRQDFIWRHRNGNVAIWLMNGGSVIGSGVLGFVPTDWRIVGAGDFNGDGRLDILWRNIGSVPNWPLAIWFMNGLAVSGTAFLGSIDSQWFTD